MRRIGRIYLQRWYGRERLSAATQIHFFWVSIDALSRHEERSAASARSASSA